jgi:hypothetical protein
LKGFGSRNVAAALGHSLSRTVHFPGTPSIGGRCQLPRKSPGARYRGKAFHSRDSESPDQDRGAAAASRR